MRPLRIVQRQRPLGCTSYILAGPLLLLGADRGHREGDRGAGWTHSECGLVLSGGCRMSAAGVITWVDQNSNYVATLPIRSAIFDGDLRLNYRIGKRRASEPSLQLIFRDSCMVRLDINQGHVVEQGKRHLGTHHHIRRKGPSGREEFHVGPLSLRSPCWAVGSVVRSINRS